MRRPYTENTTEHLDVKPTNDVFPTNEGTWITFRIYLLFPVPAEYWLY